MTQKERVLDAIGELPDDASQDQIAERIDFLAAVEKGFDQLDRGEGISHEELTASAGRLFALLDEEEDAEAR